MPEVECEVVRWVDDESFPGVVEAHLLDVDGHRWSFVDKSTVFGGAIDWSSVLPMRAALRCEVLERGVRADGREVVVISTAKPDGLAADGVTEFRVSPDLVR